MPGVRLVLMPRKSPIGPEAKQIVLDAIAVAEAPIPVSELGKIARITATRVRTLLAEDLTAGRVFLWGDAKKKAYWNRDPSPAARDRLLALAGRELLNTKQLEQRASVEVPAIPIKIVKSARAQLEKEKRFERKSRVIVDMEHPHPYLEREIRSLLTSYGIEREPERIRELLDGTDRPRQSSSVDEVAEIMFAALNRIAFAPGTTVTFYRLRQQPELAEIPKEIFDKAALLLQRDRRALLSVHDHAARLPTEEQQRLVTDGLGTYYVSIYAR
ncbi:MAG TPA: hypothetical protein VKG25_14930 [Bryobacteraceae bacterium]|nr:hypothetical protein [Bryobacteraceae bacterium]